MNEDKKYKKIVIEFDGPIMQNDKLTYEDVTVAEARENFRRWCCSYEVTMDSTSPRVHSTEEYEDDSN